MKKNCLAILIVAGLMFTACSSGKESTGVWVNKDKIQGKSFHKVFIVVMTADIQARVRVENDLAAAAIAKGYEAVKSVEAIPPVLSDPKLPTKDEVVSKVKSSGCDAVFVASLLDKNESVHYTPGKTAYSTLPYYTYYPGYYSNWYPSVSTPSYYSHDKKYFMLSNLYDAASEEIMWSVQSEIFNPETLEKFSRTYTTSLIKQLEKEKMLKKEAKKD